MTEQIATNVLNKAAEIDRVDYSRSRTLLSATELPLFGSANRIGGNFPTLLVVGCGGIGFWAAIYGAMIGFFNSVVLMDEDKIEASNISRIPVPGSWIGKYKVTALARTIKWLRPACTVVPLRTKASELTLGALEDKLFPSIQGLYIVDCTDDARAQNTLYRWANLKSMQARRQRANYVKAGYEGLNFGIYTEINTWVPQDYRPGYNTQTTNVLTSAAAGAYAITSLIFGGNTTEAKFNMTDKVLTTQKAEALAQSLKQLGRTQ